MKFIKQIFLLGLGALMIAGCTSPEVRMHKAAFHGNARTVQHHLERGVSANAMTRSGTTSLHAAAYRGNAAVIDLLLLHGANPNLVDGRGWIPLHQAVDQGNGFVVEMLIKAGANVNTRMGGTGYTALDWANHRQWPGVANLIRKHGGHTSDELNAGRN